MALAEYVYTVLLKPRLIRRVANSILLSLLPKTVQIRGATVHLNPEDPVVSGALTFGVFERDEIGFFLRACREGMTVIDIGANVGVYTALAMRAVGKRGRVIAVEPHPDSVALLRRTIAANAADGCAAVDVVERAANNKDGAARLYLNPDNKGDNRLYFSELTPQAAAIDIQTDRIDMMLRRLGIHRIDFLKIDVQGAELEAIEGARQTIENSETMLLLSEFWPEGIRMAGNRDAINYLHLLADFGFKLYDLPTQAPLRSDKDFRRLISRLPGRKYTNIVGRKGAVGKSYDDLVT